MTVYGAAGFTGGSSSKNRFFAVNDREVIFCGSFHTEEFREAVSVGLANVLRYGGVMEPGRSLTLSRNG